ncbi:hypothetical protein B0H16DRAFT_1733813 [Mycena metata]|uniref:Uncharacterized protein n=1 Tax=Mycena metata TaxID=1033252 RepID=A0AAD7HZ06_9AGAR|nr:hypothetical protein B0H16DRAFT_1733813 [Mycena metata]
MTNLNPMHRLGLVLALRLQDELLEDGVGAGDDAGRECQLEFREIMRSQHFCERRRRRDEHQHPDAHGLHAPTAESEQLGIYRPAAYRRLDELHKALECTAPAPTPTAQTRPLRCVPLRVSHKRTKRHRDSRRVLPPVPLWVYARHRRHPLTYKRAKHIPPASRASAKSRSGTLNGAEHPHSRPDQAHCRRTRLRAATTSPRHQLDSDGDGAICHPAPAPNTCARTLLTDACHRQRRDQDYPWRTPRLNEDRPRALASQQHL